MTREQLIQKLTDNHLIVSSEWVRTNAPEDFAWLVEKMGHLKADDRQIEEFVSGNWWVQYGFGESGYNLVAAESKKALDQPNWGEGEYMYCGDDLLTLWARELGHTQKERYHVGLAVTAKLEELGLSKSWLANATGVHRTSMGARLKQRNWTFDTMFDVSIALGMTMEEFGKLLDDYANS